ncbi:hypothetical protein Atai01_09420 [Amycolatopsis taiwanensis]|uniref:Uncharacterized protein n=1 Tax=Amycolatopsis taiwanensis TaxID=342230 RepID=A0A9W6QV65_9PSEU|nr:hypothetical protein Atai01_09420 [Amycolatopsis taiwanensis]
MSPVQDAVSPIQDAVSPVQDAVSPVQDAVFLIQEAVSPASRLPFVGFNHANRQYGCPNPELGPGEPGTHIETTVKGCGREWCGTPG